MGGKEEGKSVDTRKVLVVEIKREENGSQRGVQGNRRDVCSVSFCFKLEMNSLTICGGKGNLVEEGP